MRQAVLELTQASDLEDLQRAVRHAARRLVDAYGATIVLLDEGQCFYADEDAASPLWKGQRFPIDQCISGWTMQHRRPAVIDDVRADDRIPPAAYVPEFVRSMVMVPVGDPPVGAIVAYWSRPGHARDRDVDKLSQLADATAQTLDRLRATAPGPSS